MRIGYQQDTSLYENYTAVILAAGLSSRMKDFKPLLAVDGRTAIEGLVEAAQGAGIKDIVVVTGYRREDLQPVIRRYELTEAFNPAYETGMFSSIRAGIAKAAEQKYKGTLLIPVDCPLISISVLRKVMDEADGHFAVPTYEGKKGHPLYIPAGFYDEILTHDGEGGLKTITDRYWDQMDRIPVNEEGCIMDMDTPEGYEEIRQFVEQGFTRTKLSVAAARRRFILIRHGQTQQHEEPMFIGQYDVPLNDEGREQMQKLGVELAGVLQEHYVGDVRRDLFGTPLEKDMPDWSNTVYCSDLQRAQESAEIFAKALEENGAMVDDVENGVFPTGVTVKPSPPARKSECRLLHSCATLAMPRISQCSLKIFSVTAATSASRMLLCCSNRLNPWLGPLPSRCQLPHSSRTIFSFRSGSHSSMAARWLRRIRRVWSAPNISSYQPFSSNVSGSLP